MVLRFGSLNEAVVVAEPAFQAAFHEQVRYWDGEPPPQHDFFSQVVVPRVNAAIAEGNDGDLADLFAFFELMATSDDSDVRDVLRDTVLEGLVIEPSGSHDIAISLMGPATRQHWADVAAR